MDRGGRRAGVAALVAAMVVTACSDSPSVTPDTVASTEVTAPAPAADDGLLTLAVLVPEAGKGAELGSSLEAGTLVAVEEVNRAGGVVGRPVRLVVRTETDDVGEMAAIARELVADGVDAIIGPASNTVALGALRSIIGTGAVACSPTASALALDEFPDQGRFLRSIPSDSLQAVALAQLVEQSGARSVVLAHLDDGYGRPLAAVTATALADAGVEVQETVPFDATDSAARDAAARIADAAPDAVVVIADSEAGPLLVGAVHDLAPRIEFVVNDAQRSPEQDDAYVSDRVSGVAPAASVDDPALLAQVRAIDPNAVGWYASNAYDCVTVLALAATVARSTLPDDIAGQVRAVSASGTRCTTFTACKSQLAQRRNINYDGPDGDLDLGADGDPVRARFDLFRFDESGVDVTAGSIVVGRTP